MTGGFIDTLVPAMRRSSILSGPASRSRKGIRFMDLSNVSIRYRVVGDGDVTVVLAPDPPITLEQYDSIIERLSVHFRVVVFELPAMGFSLPRLGFDFAYEPWTETMATFLRRLDLGPYVLALPCIAGFSAIGIANRHPDMVRALVTTQMPAWSEASKWVRSRSKFGILTVPIYGQILLQLLKKKRASSVYREICKKNIEEFVELTDWSMENGACFTFASAARNFMKEDAPPLVVPVNVPSISIWGDSDPSHERVNTDKESVRQLLPQAEIFHLPEAGHYMEVEEPALFSDLVTDFIFARVHQPS